MKKALVFINQNKKEALRLLPEIETFLSGRGIACVVYEDGMDVDGDVAVTLGGDGTVLFAARMAALKGLPLFSINLGTVGFIASVQAEVWEKAFAEWLDGPVACSRRMMLEIEVYRDGEKLFGGICLNEAVISAAKIAKLITLKVSAVDDSQGALHLGTYRADGLILATPTGSTAYSIAAGGPVLDPEIQAIIVNPICSFSLANRAMLLPPEISVLVELSEVQRSGILLTLDGQVTHELEAGDKITVRRTSYDAVLIGSTKEGFYRALNTKLFRGEYA